MSDKVQLIKEEIERRIELLEPLECEYNNGSIDAYKGILRFINSLPEEPSDETPKANYNERYKRIAQTEQFKESYWDKSLGKEESASDDLDFLVISLEETIGTSPHSREVIKEYLQKAAEWGRNHFEDKSEMVSEDLEEEIENYIKDSLAIKFPTTDKEQIKADIRYIARHFAEWQKQKDQETIELAEDHAMLAGMMKEREEMMKDAVIAWVNTYESVTNPYDNEVSFITNLSPSKFKNKETVKIVIVKEN